MTDSNRSMNEVPGLIEERRRYEGWLTALEARREDTPEHVFLRVQADYRARLQRVAEALASHRQAIEEERASVQSRLSLLEAEERLRRDERAELELRAHVGELVADDADSAFRTVDESIQHLVTEREGLEARIAELQALLDEGAPRPEPRSGSAGAAPEVEPQSLAQAEESTEPSIDEPAVADVRGELESVPVAASATGPDAAATDGSAGDRERPSTPSFDELAFLSSVVGADDQEPLIERRDTASAPPPGQPTVSRNDPNMDLLAGMDHSKSVDQPFAANIPANTPIVLRPAGTIEQSKTLRCNECGALNYPTEWYCERCGAELAAL